MQPYKIMTSSHNPVRTYSRRKKSDSFESLPSRVRPPINDEEERKHFSKVVSVFKLYKDVQMKKLNFTNRLIEIMPENQQILIKGYKESLTALEHCVAHNQELIDLLLTDVEYMFENSFLTNLDTEENLDITSADNERVHTTLKQFVRDWAIEGEEERKQCYQPIIDDITRIFPITPESPQNNVKILVPGSGLARLLFEIARKGYSCQGNEFSLYMLFASFFILNRCSGQLMHSVYPWIHQVDNNLTSENQMQLVRFPDVCPSNYLNPNSVNHRLSIAAGDFLEIYNTPDWNCVATCFFIDCANNIVDFIEKIYEILLPGGVWINLGPLLYHFSNMPKEFSIEPSYAVVKEVITGVGFKFEKEEIGVKTKYCQNPHSMLQYEYNCVYFVCRKPE